MSAAQTARAGLVIAHPGHELRILKWVQRNRPLVHVLTDGSGPDRPPRTGSTAALLERCEARLAGVFGAWSDREFYAMMLAGDPAPFEALAERLAEDWRREGVTVVAADKLEGFSTSHDVCRLVVDAAVAYSRKRWGREVASYEFALEDLRRPVPVEGEIAIDLDDEAFAAKRQAAVDEYPEIASEVDRLVAAYGEAPFRVEILQPVNGRSPLLSEGAAKPFYEKYGEKQIAAGHYHDLITRRDHIRPLADALEAWAARASPGS
jgi:hypothetical protein